MQACTSDRGTATTTTSSLTETGLSCGLPYTYIVTCTDYAGNSVSTSATSFSTSSCTSGSVSGGTTTTDPTTKKITTWTSIAPDEPAVVEDIDEDAGIKQIEIEVIEEVSNVKVTIKRYEEKPEEVAVAKVGTVYSYLEIETQNLEEKLAQATMTIQIEENWLAENSIDKDDMALFKFNEDSSEWDELVTTYIESDETHHYYDVVVDSFSFFAIGEKQAVIEEREGEEEVEGLKTTNLWLWIVIGILVLAAIIGGGVAIKKRRK